MNSNYSHFVALNHYDNKLARIHMAKVIILHMVRYLLLVRFINVISFNDNNNVIIVEMFI